jgi:integrase
VAGQVIKRTGKKRINGKPENLYYVVYNMNGKPKWEKVLPTQYRLQARRQDADDLLALRLNQIRGGEFIEPSDITFEEYKEVWLKKYARGEVRPTTMDQYESLYSKHIIPELGEKRLPRIGVEDIQGFKSALQQKGLGPQMVKHNLRLVRQMLNHAVDWGYIRDNPAAKVRYPKIPRREKEMESNILTPAEIRLLLEHVPDRWGALILVAITGGLRIGEILAMRWSNVEWNSGQYPVLCKGDVGQTEEGPSCYVHGAKDRIVYCSGGPDTNLP